MSTLQTVQDAQEDLEKLQVALGAVSTGLDAVETAIEVAGTARRRLRRAVRFAIIVGLVVAAVVVIKRILQPDDEPEPTSD